MIPHRPCRPASAVWPIRSRPGANHESPEFSNAATAQCRSACRQPIARRAIRDMAPTGFPVTERHRFVAL